MTSSIIFLAIYFFRVGSKLYGHILGIPMCTNRALLVAFLFEFYYERDFTLSLSDITNYGDIEAVIFTSRN